MTICGNPVLSIPNGALLEPALEKLDFMVSMDIYLNETTRHADLILPGVTPLERDHYAMLGIVAVRNVAKYSRAVMPIRGQGRPEWEIGLDLTERLQRLRGGLGGRAAAALTRGLRAVGPARMLDLQLRTGPFGLRRGRANGVPGGLSLAKVEAAAHGMDLGPSGRVRCPIASTPPASGSGSPPRSWSAISRASRPRSRRGRTGARGAWT